MKLMVACILPRAAMTPVGGSGSEISSKTLYSIRMEPLSARMDFEFDPLPEGFADRVTELVNAEIAADRPIEISFLPRAEALADEDLIRTKVNLIPESVTETRL